MLKVGDKVKFLNAVGGGVITGFVSPKVANVKDEAGFEVPMLVTELVKNVRYVDVPVRTAKEAEKVKEKETKKPLKEIQPLFASSAGKPATPGDGAWFLAFVPEVPTMPLSGEIKAWLVNDSKYTLLYHFSLLVDGYYLSEKSGRLAPYSTVPLKGFVHQDLSSFPDFGFQILLFDKSSSTLKPAIVKTLKVNPVKLYKDSSFVANNYFSKKGLLVDIREKDMSKELEKLKQHDFSAPEADKENGARLKKVAKSESAEIREVDLHIGELVESYAGLSNKEILDIQMERFKSEMDAAIKGGTQRIVFIHGVGQGTLKNELRKVLSTAYKKYDVQDASFREYGYGATMVILKRG